MENIKCFLVKTIRQRLLALVVYKMLALFMFTKIQLQC